jgi:hypothetical protein
MSGFVDMLLGKPTKAQQAEQASQAQAQQIQQRELFASQEQNAQLQAESVASGRRLRGIGRQQLAFQGNTLGVLPDLTAGRAATPAGS